MSQADKTVSAIVPVFNEEKTVAKVIEALLKNPLIDEVIAVNDGSADKSLKILKQFGDKITLVDLKKNHGKGFALASGVKRANGEIITFWDADFTNLSDRHIETVLNPILQSKARAVVGLYYAPIPIFKSLSGQRAYHRKDLLPHLDAISITRLGVEVYLNGAFKESETKKIPLRDLEHLSKHKKYDPQKAFKEYIKAGLEITKVLGSQEVTLDIDTEVLYKLAKADNFKELKSAVNEIKSKKIKQIWQDYILKYIK